MLKKDSKALTDSGELKELSHDEISQVAGGFGNSGGKQWLLNTDDTSSFGEGGGPGWKTNSPKIG